MLPSSCQGPPNPSVGYTPGSPTGVPPPDEIRKRNRLAVCAPRVSGPGPGEGAPERGRFYGRREREGRTAHSHALRGPAGWGGAGKGCGVVGPTWK